jgi:hypothetical protein
VVGVVPWQLSGWGCNKELVGWTVVFHIDGTAGYLGVDINCCGFAYGMIEYDDDFLWVVVQPVYYNLRARNLVDKVAIEVDVKALGVLCLYDDGWSRQWLDVGFVFVEWIWFSVGLGIKHACHSQREE